MELWPHDEKRKHGGDLVVEALQRADGLNFRKLRTIRRER
jgi:hypothetical protein